MGAVAQSLHALTDGCFVERQTMPLSTLEEGVCACVCQGKGV